jgi:hypothetical protein
MTGMGHERKSGAFIRMSALGGEADMLFAALSSMCIWDKK